MSRVAVRRNCCTGETYRSSSSTAGPRCSGCSASQDHRPCSCSATTEPEHGVAGGLVAGDHEQQPEHLELGVGEPLAVDLGVDDAADDVVARVGPAVGGHGQAVLHHPGQRGHRLLGVLGGAGVVGAEQGVAPLEDEVPVVAGACRRGRRAPAPASRPRPHRPGRTRPRAGRGSRVAFVLHRRPEPLDRPRREDRLQDPPQPAVARVVHVQHHLAEHGEAVVGERRQEGAARLRREPLLVAVDLGDERVRGDHPETRAVDELDHRVVAEQSRRRRLGVPGDAAVAAQRVEGSVWHPVDERPVGREVDVDDVGDQPGALRRRCRASEASRRVAVLMRGSSGVGGDVVELHGPRPQRLVRLGVLLGEGRVLDVAAGSARSRGRPPWW